MHEVTFSYRHWLGYTRTRSVRWSSRWQECNEKQLLQALNARLLNEADPVKQLRLLRKWARLSWSQMHAIELETLTELRRLLTFVTEPESLFNSAILQSFKHRGRTYFSPADQLVNCTFVEFAHADSFVSEYAETRQPEALLRAMAVLFRPALSRAAQKADGWNGDRRRPYQFDLCKAESERLAGLRPELLEYFVLFFSGCKKHVVQSFPKLFAREQESDLPADQNAWATAQKVLLKSKPGWTLDHIQQENLYNALDLLQDLKIEHQRELHRNQNLR